MDDRTHSPMPPSCFSLNFPEAYIVSAKILKSSKIFKNVLFNAVLLYSLDLDKTMVRERCEVPDFESVVKIEPALFLAALAPFLHKIYT